MPNAKNAGESTRRRILVVGRTGSGKSTQIWTLPGRKFAYLFDPNSMSTLKGCDLEYEEYYPDFLELDATLKGFNKGSRSDKLPSSSKREPSVYMKWVEDINRKVEQKFFEQYEWLIFDSVTFISKALMDRQLFINNKYGDVEDRADYRIVGAKLSDIFTSISGMPINIYATGHVRAFEDETTHRVETQLNLPGRSRGQLPLVFTDIWEATVDNTDKGLRYYVRTKPDPRGLRDIRSSIQGLATMEDVTLSNFSDLQAGKAGIGGLLMRQYDPKVVNMRR